VVKLDAVDTPPIFDAINYEFRLDENSVTGSTVGRISASDPDTADRDLIKYRLIGENSEL
jgi:hypothetical protein